MVTNHSLFAEFEARFASLIDRIVCGNFDILYNVLSNFFKFVSLSFYSLEFYVGVLDYNLARRSLYGDVFSIVIA